MIYYHLAPVPAWRAAQESGEPYKPATYDQVRAADLGEGERHTQPPPPKTRPLTPGSSLFPLPKDGFTHLTADPAALLGVANQFYGDSTDAWTCVALDGDRLVAEVRLEPAAPVGEKEPGAAQREEGGGGAPLLFPHLYGPIPTDAAVREHAVVREGEGRGAFLAIEGLAS